MPHQPVRPEEIQELRLRLYRGEQRLEAATVRRLLDELDRLRAELGDARVTFARTAAEALEKRLRDVGTFNHGGCPSCREAEARAFLARLQRFVQGAAREKPPRRR